MTTAFLMKAAVAIFVLSLGVLVLWANNAYDKNNGSEQ